VRSTATSILLEKNNVKGKKDRKSRRQEFTALRGNNP